MKYLFVFLLLCILAFQALYGATRPKFLIRVELSGKKNASGEYLADVPSIALQGEIIKKMTEYLPCSQYTTMEYISTVLGQERQRQLLGGGNDDALKEMAGAIGADYLLVLNVIADENSIFFNAICLDPQERSALARVSDRAPFGSGAIDVARRIADKFVEQICRYEICPYKGEINVHVLSEINIDTKKEYPVYCQGEDRKYILKYKELKKMDKIWKFDKVNKYHANGFLDFLISEETDKEIENGCYKCPSGDVYRRYYHETMSKNGNINGLSKESMIDGVRVNDARIEITFKDDGTYFIKVDATSKEDEIKETIYKTAEGWCDTDYGPPKNITNKIDIPLHYMFGPFKGTAKDKTLSYKPDPIVTTDPVSSEKTTIYVDFDLKRD
jgi:hypothetical protein